jgi:hypothetical protein
MNHHAQGEHVDPRSIWREYARPHGDPAGEALADFALRLFAIVPNSAAVERLFSKFGLIHTKLRNRLGADKVRKTTIVAGDIASKYGQARSRRRKRKFGSADPDVVDSGPASTVQASEATIRDVDDDDDEPVDATFGAMAEDLVDEVNEADLADALDLDPSALPTPIEDPVPLTQTQGLLISNLFVSASTRDGGNDGAAVRGLKQFWKLGQDGLARELQFQEAIVRTETL